jgi:hypothetical protein
VTELEGFYRIPDEIRKAYKSLPNGWFKKEDIDFDELFLEEMVINGLVEKEVMKVTNGQHSEFWITYHKL